MKAINLMTAASLCLAVSAGCAHSSSSASSETTADSASEQANDELDNEGDSQIDADNMNVDGNEEMMKEYEEGETE